MDRNEAGAKGEEIDRFITYNFGLEGNSFYERLQFLKFASRVKEVA